MSITYAKGIFAQEVKEHNIDYSSSKILPLKLNEQEDLANYIEYLTIDGKLYTFIHKRREWI